MNVETPPEHSTSFGLTTETIKTVREALDIDDQKFVLTVIKSMHAADVADLIEGLSPPHRRQVLTILKDEEQLEAEVLTELDEHIREEFLEQLTPQELAATMAELETDDAFTLLDDLDLKQQQEVLQAMPEEDRFELEQTLSYPENSAGRLMQREVVVAPQNWTIGQVIDSLEDYQELPENFYDIFIVDRWLHPVGSVSLAKLLKHSRRTPIREIMDRDIKAMPVTMDQEEVAYLFQQYGLASAPVVDDKNIVIGMITVDDVMFVIQEEADEDFIRLGLVEEDTFHGTIRDTSLSRLRWLSVTFINTLIASSVISHFEPILKEVVAVAVLMPIVAAMGGNCGMQVVTVMVRAIAKKDLHAHNFWNVLWREIVVSCIHAFIFATLIATISAIWYHNIKLGMTLGAAMIFNIIWSALAGTFFPVFLHKIGLDPAISSGPILTTTTDVLGFSVFLGLSSIFLL
jgi:magnesium transporter